MAYTKKYGLSQNVILNGYELKKSQGQQSGSILNESIMIIYYLLQW